MSVRVREVKEGLAVDVRVSPGSSADRILGEREGVLRVSLSAPAQGGRANRALVRFLAKRIGVRRSTVRIAAGERDRRKTLILEGAERAAVESALDGLLGPGRGKGA